jgi:Protein of unknown function with HXXEE motif
MTSETGYDRATIIWLWLFPLTFLVHIAEEYWGGEGFSAYLARARGVQLSPTRFLVMNGIGWVLMIVGVILARKLGFAQWLLVCLGMVVMGNGLSHTINTLVTGEYNPGVISGLLIWIPLGAATLLRLKKEMQGRRYWVALAVGIAIQGVVALMALTGGKPFRV